MSTATETPNVPTLEVVEKKPNFINRRIVTPIRNHPKIATAILLGVALVGGAALVAKNDESSPADSEDATEDVAETTVA